MMPFDWHAQQIPPITPTPLDAISPAQAFINAVLSEDTTEGMRGLVDEGVVNATANFDMAQPDQEFKSITDWMN